MQQLKEDYRSDPDRDPERLAAEMWSRLGVAAGDDDPVVKELITLVDDLLRRVHQDMTRDRRVEYLASAEPDHEVLEQIELAVTRYGSHYAESPAQPAPAQQQPTVQQPADEQAVQTAAEVSDEIVRELALPVLRDLATTRPDLVARHSPDELMALLGRVIAQHLAG